MAYQKRLQFALLISWLFFVGVSSLFVLKIRAQEDAFKNLVRELNQDIEYPPPITSNEDPHSNRSLFTFSPDKRHIAFIEDVFQKYGEDPDRYWALKIFDVVSQRERLLFVDDSKLSNYEWRDVGTIRMFHNGGTGVRMYKDMRIEDESIFWKKYKYFPERFWTPDEKYAAEIRSDQDARIFYYGK